MSEQKDPNKQQLNISIDEQTAEGFYSNLAIINHSASEFIVDYVTVMPGAPKARVKSRIILTPEQAHGEVETNDPPPIPLNFGPAGEA